MEGLQGMFQIVPLDFVILGGIAIIVALDSVRGGIGRASAIVVALISAQFLSSLLNDTAFIGAMVSSPMMEVGAFLLLVGASYFTLRRMGLEYVSGGIGQPMQSAIVGVAVAIVCAVTWLSIPALSDYWEFGRQISTIFAEQFRLIWILGAFGALAFARG